MKEKIIWGLVRLKPDISQIIRTAAWRFRGVRAAAAQLSCGSMWAVTISVTGRCVYARRGEGHARTHAHGGGERKTQSLYWFQLINAQHWGMLLPLLTCECVCEVNTFLTFQHFPKRHKILATPRSLQTHSPCWSLLSSSDCALKFSTPLCFLIPPTRWLCSDFCLNPKEQRLDIFMSGLNWPITGVTVLNLKVVSSFRWICTKVILFNP